jgi:hypothetical protein
MFHSLMMFLAPEAACQAQATPNSPPAVARPAGPPPARNIARLRLIAAVLGNAAGFAVLMGGCWLVLVLIQNLVYTP